jgi:amino acid adenylation domain-containing protein/non-ribosomal peptide synthase protein (TIGR01720 family)
MSKSDELLRQQSELSPAKRALLERWMRGGHPAEPPIIPRRSEQDEAPLSFAQQRLWFLELLEPGSAAYHISSSVSFTGPLSVGALRSALDEVLRRHEVLRAHFSSEGGMPVQRFSQPVQTLLPLVDLSGLADEARLPAARRLSSAESRRPFDLARGPLLRPLLLRLAADRHVLQLTLHHVIADGWSLALLSRELVSLYEAARLSLPPPLPPLPIQYADYAAWQRQRLSTGKLLEAELSYWREQLAGAPQSLSLPSDGGRGAGHQGGAAVKVRLDGELTLRLKELAKAEGATLYMVLLAGFWLLLMRYGGVRDVVVGAPVAGRGRAELEGLVGLFVNTLVLRGRVEGGETFREVVRAARAVCLGAYAHQEVPFERVVEELKVGREAGRTPLVQVMFNMFNFAQERVELSDLLVEHFSNDDVSSKFDLTLYAWEKDDGIRLNLTYNADLFTRARMVEMAEQLKHLYAQAAESPDENSDRYSLVTGTSEALLPRPARPLLAGREVPVHHLFTEQARRVAERPAVVDKDGNWTYGELETVGNLLSNRLRAGGIERGDVVAVYSQRSASLVCALLGVLKAGAAFAILDPAYPTARLIRAIEVSRPRGIIELESAGELPAGLKDCVAASGCLRVSLPNSAVAARASLEGCSMEEAGEVCGPGAAAYVAFTSGSTGVPKGVIGTHRPLSHFLRWHIQTFGLKEADRFSMLSGLAHDPLLRDIFTPLCLGATLCVPEPEQIGSPGWLKRWMEREGISVAHLTPAMGQLLTISGAGDGAAEVGGRALETLRYVFWGGDRLTRLDLERLQRLAPSAVSVNFYGTTETPQAVGFYVVPREAALERDADFKKAGANVPLGRGIDGVQLLILNDAERLAGIGELGELYVRTPYLTEGYLGDEELTRQRFITNPYTKKTDDRLYRTGDVARYLPAGEVEYLGRADRQVKVRGFRIELGEVEAALRGVEGVREAVVEAREGAGGQARLVGWVVREGEGGGAWEGGGWRERLREQLPEYMVPSSLMEVERWPLTPNGKIDRRALPEPVLGAGAVRAWREPSGPVEEAVAEVWREVLGAERVGAEENFFELGGHSLLAARVMARLQEVFPVSLSLREFFERPEVAALAAHIERALREGRGAHLPPIEKAPRDGRLPLSFAQRRLWFLAQLEPESAAYNIPAAVSIRGELNLDALCRAFNSIIERHEVLRTTFVSDDSEPAQVIAPGRVLKITVADLCELSEGRRDEEVRRLVVAEARRPFDLTRWPLLRVSLLRVAEREHIALLTMHHIISDGWSMGVLIGELATLYESFSTGKPAALPLLRIQYADYSHWQRQWLRGEALETQLSYWQEKLRGHPPVLNLPVARPRPAIQSNRGARLSQHLPWELVEGLKVLCRRQGVTLYMALLAVFKTLLYRYTSQPDIVVGSPVANRSSVQCETLIGFFANTMVLRTDLSGDPTFRQLLGRVRETALGAYAHQDVPFERLVDELQAVRDLSFTPLFQVMFTLQNAPLPERRSSGLSISFLETESGTAKFDLELLAAEKGSGLAFTWEYNTDLFDRAAVAQMAEHFRRLLLGALSNPERAVSALPLLNEDEERRLLFEWNDTRSDLASDKCAQQLFEEQAERTPHAVAVLFEGGQLTYDELNRRSNRWARALVARGVGPDTLVTLLDERGPDLLTAILAVFKAGGAYLPLDPHDPRARLKRVLAQGRSRLLLTTRELAPTLSELTEGSEGGGPEVIFVEDLSRGEGADGNLPARGGWSNLAYVIYTSGSTGVPKGAMVEHRGMLNHLRAKIDDLRLTDKDVVAQTASQCFDISVWQFLAALLVGGSVRIFPDEIARDGTRLLDEVARHSVTILETVPSLLQASLGSAASGEAAPPDLPALRWSLVTGEALPPELCRRWLTLYPKIALLNAYGPTECSDDVTHHLVELPPPESVARMPIGRPILNTRLYVLDPRKRPVPVGVDGELYVGGLGVGRGYLHDPARTAERFVPDPFSAEPGARLYRTGDLMRHLPGGEIEFLGRVDFQVKVRGFRIELGEVEAALRGVEGVREAVVEAREGAGGQARLVGWVVCEGAWEEGAWRERLREQLPEYMVPSSLTEVERWPLTPNGKIDRRALPEPVLGAASRDYAPPRTLVESKLAEVWGQVLRLKQVGIHDNFFELGGDSILIIQIISRARQAGIELTLRQVIQHQTIAELAALNAPARLVEAEQGAVTGPTPLTPAQYWLLEQNLPDLHHFNQSLMLEVRQPLLAGLLSDAAGRLLAHHDALRLRLRRRGAEWEQFGEHFDGDAPFSVVDLSSLPERVRAEAMRAAAEDMQASLNLFVGPLMRLALFDLGARRTGRLLIVIHHLAVDGVSWRILLDDLQTAYEQLGRGGPVTLPAKTTSFKRWAEGLTEYARSAELRQELDYWLAEPRRQARSLPRDFMKGVNTVGSSRSLTASLTAEESRSLLQVVPGAFHAQINEVLLQALAQTFAHWTGRRRLLVDLENHGREEVIANTDLSRTVGWFTAIYPALLDAGVSSDADEALRSIKEQLRAVPHNGLGYGLLRHLSADAEVKQELGSLPQPEVIFNYLGQFDNTLSETSVLGLAPESSGAPRSTRQTRRYLFEVSGSVVGGRLHLTWKYSENLHRRATVEHLMRRFLEALRTLISRPAQTVERTTAGLSGPDLTQEKIDKALAELGLG